MNTTVLVVPCGMINEVQRAKPMELLELNPESEIQMANSSGIEF